MTSYGPSHSNNHYKYLTRHVGGQTEVDLDTNYIKNQTNVIKSRNESIPDTYNPPYHDMIVKTPGLFGDRFQPTNKQHENADRYDPLGDFMHKNGVLQRDNNTRWITHYIHIDSSQRNKAPKPVLLNDQYKLERLVSDPLIFRCETSDLIIEQSNNPYFFGDKFSLTGLSPKKKTLKIISQKNLVCDTSDTSIVQLIEFKTGSEYMTVNISPEIFFTITTPSSTDDFDNIRAKLDDINSIKNYDTTDVFIEFSGIKGSGNDNFISNIPTSTLNTKHRIYLFNQDPSLQPPNNLDQIFAFDASKWYDPCKFYIKLIDSYRGQPLTITNNYSFKIVYYYYGGIPINRINAEFPIDSNHLQGFHTVSALSDSAFDDDVSEFTDSDDYIYVKMPKTIKCRNKAETNTLRFYAGGNNMTTVGFKSIETSFPDPNHYLISLEKTFEQVVSVSMVSSEFPNVEKVVKNIPESRRNNMLYWQNIEDGENLYSVEITPGNYNALSLASEIITKMNNTKRIVKTDPNGFIVGSKYTSSNFFTMEINKDTDLVTFRSFKEALLSKPFFQTDPPIVTSTTDAEFSYLLSIKHDNHFVEAGNRIVISGAIAYLGIPADVINTEHTVESIIDDNTYTIKIKHFNLEPVKNNNGGGTAVKIRVPSVFRLKFDMTNTIGEILGFRNVGNSGSVTQYSNVIKNSDPYDQELMVTESGEQKVIRNNVLRLSGDNYILVVCKQFRGIYSVGNVKNAFAKIMLNGDPGTPVYRSFACTPLYFHDPIQNLNELEFEFYGQNGDLYDFDGIDHSFTLEIVVLAEVPKGTGITSRRGKIT